MSDVGFTHIALPVLDVDASTVFYSRYASMQVVHRRADPASGRRVVWLSDLTRPFVVVLIESPDPVVVKLEGFAHLGVACASRTDVDRLCGEARAEGRTTVGPLDYGYPVGYWAFITDPDGHNLEISYGQEVGLTVQSTRSSS